MSLTDLLHALDCLMLRADATGDTDTRDALLAARAALRARLGIILDEPGASDQEAAA